jgi:hypothetical protein
LFGHFIQYSFLLFIVQIPKATDIAMANEFGDDDMLGVEFMLEITVI